jgi:hypothetical protein
LAASPRPRAPARDRDRSIGAARAREVARQVDWQMQPGGGGGGGHRQHAPAQAWPRVQTEERRTMVTAPVHGQQFQLAIDQPSSVLP